MSKIFYESFRAIQELKSRNASIVPMGPEGIIPTDLRPLSKEVNHDRTDKGSRKGT